MNYLRVGLLLSVMISIGLYAGVPEPINKESAQKEFNLSVKDSPQNKSKILITMTYKGNEYSRVDLINNGKKESIKAVVKDGMVSVSFETDKKNLEKSSLLLSSDDPVYNLSRCPPTQVIYLKEYVE